MSKLRDKLRSSIATSVIYQNEFIGNHHGFQHVRDAPMKFTERALLVVNGHDCGKLWAGGTNLIHTFIDRICW